MPTDGSFWPSSARGLSSTLRTHSESLRAIGVNLEFPNSRSVTGRRLVSITFTPIDETPVDSVSNEFVEMLEEDGDEESLSIFRQQTMTVS